MEELFLVRHGQSIHHVKGLTGGWTNTPLTELGQQQAQLTGHELRKFLPDSSVAFYTSDLKRALQTAQIIGSALGITPIAEEALRELNWGVVVDMTLEDARKFEQEKTEPLIDWVPFPEAESWRMLHQRITPFLEKINKTEPDTVLIVSHGNAIEECIFWWLEFALEQRRNRSFVVDPCSITYLRKNDWQQKVVVYANRVNHLQSLSL